jgi:hypothetical protein
MVGEHSTAAGKTQTFIFHEEAEYEGEAKRRIRRAKRVLKNLGRAKAKVPAEDSLPALL